MQSKPMFLLESCKWILLYCRFFFIAFIPTRTIQNCASENMFYKIFDNINQQGRNKNVLFVSIKSYMFNLHVMVLTCNPNACLTLANTTVSNKTNTEGRATINLKVMEITRKLIGIMLVLREIKR